MCRDTKEKPRLPENVCCSAENSEGMPKKGIPFCAFCGFCENGLTFYIPVGIIRIELTRGNAVNSIERSGLRIFTLTCRKTLEHDKQ